MGKLWGGLWGGGFPTAGCINQFNHRIEFVISVANKNIFLFRNKLVYLQKPKELLTVTISLLQ